MLNNPDSTFVAESPHVPFDDSTMVNRDWRWGEAMNSTITLPSEESISADVGGQAAGRTSKADKRRSRLGMSGLRDMLKMLTRSNQHRPPLPIHSTTSFSTESSDNGHAPPRYPQGKVPTYGRRRAKTSTGPDSQSSVRERDARAPSPYNVVNLSSLSVKSSPRRPSLASIFRIGNKTKSTSSNSTSMNASNEALSTEGSAPHTRESSSSTGDPGEEDWDRMDSPLFDLELPKMNKDVATIRGRSPYMQSSRLPSSSSSNRPQTPKRSTSGSQQSSPWPEASPVLPGSGGILNSGSSRTTRLSNVEEIVDDSGDPLSYTKSSKRSSVPSPVRTRSGRLPPSKTGSVRSMPPQPLSGARPDVQLAMTPENIKPLFENSKEVHARLVDCINEIRGLLAEL
jgi:serine/arginine repetitive matrix protein 2